MGELSEALVDRLLTLHQACVRTDEVIARSNIETLNRDFVHQLALSKAVEIVGEIASTIVRKWPSFADGNPHLRLRDATAMRHVLVHGYDTISFDRLWFTAVEDVTALRDHLIPILLEAGEDVA